MDHLFKENQPMIYLASPYTGRTQNPEYNKEMEAVNYLCAVNAVGLLMENGAIAYSPIVHWHMVSQFHPSIGYEDYLRADVVMLERCDELHVLQLDGWFLSTGIQFEIKYAQSKGKPIKYLKIKGTDIVYDKTA